MFVMEFVVRLWSMTCVSKYQGWWGFVRLISNPMYLIDLAVIAATITALVIDSRKNVLSVLLRGFRMLQFFETRYQLWKLFTAAVWLQRFQLLVCLYLCLVILFLGAFLIYYLEVGHNQDIETVASAVWFMLTTFTTVGYGDIVPVTLSGKVVTGVFMLMGTAIFCLPGGVIGASLALKLNEERTLRSNVVRRDFAARVIQNAWHVYWTSERGSRQLTQLQSRFIFLLKFDVARRKLRLSTYMCDSDTFYETYTSDTLCMNEIIRNLEVKIDRIEDRLDFEANRGDLLKSVLGDDDLIAVLGLSLARQLRRANASAGSRWTARTRHVLGGHRSKVAKVSKKNEIIPVNADIFVKPKLFSPAQPRKRWQTLKSTKSLSSFTINRSVHFAIGHDRQSNYERV